MKIHLRSEGIQLAQSLSNHDSHEVTWLVLQLGICQQCVAHEHAHVLGCTTMLYSQGVYIKRYTDFVSLDWIKDAHESIDLQDRSTVRTNAVAVRSAQALGCNTSDTTPGFARQAEALVELRAARPQLPMSSRLSNDVDSSGRAAQQLRMRPLETSRKPCASEVHGSGAVVGHNEEDTILMDSGGCHGTVQERCNETRC